MLIFSKFLWNLSETAIFEQTISFSPGEENTITESVTSLRVKIIGSLGLKLAYTIQYTEEVPVEKDHSDTETSMTLAYAF